MLNGEKFKKEIEDVDFDLAKCKGKIVNCCTTNCETCDFYDKEEYKRLISLYGSLNHLQTMGKTR